MEGQRTLLRHCNDDGVCHCDWRLTIYGCEESRPMYYIYVVNIALSGPLLTHVITLAKGIGLLIHRIFIKGHRLWDYSRGPSRGCLRPKPVDAMLFLLTLFNILRLVSSVILVADIAPDNLIARSFVFEIPWQIGVGSFTLYLVGIAQTLAESHKAISSGWLPSPVIVDLAGTWLFLWPFVVHNIFSIVAGAYADKNLWIAELFTRLLYGFWFYNNATISAAVFFAGYRLVRILKGHLSKFKESSGPRYSAVKTGIFKIQAIVVIIIICLMTFATFLLLYGILRDQIMTSTAGSVFLGVVWQYLGPLATVFVEAAIIINPTFEKNAALGTTNSSSGSGPPIKSYNTTTHDDSTSYGQSTTMFSNSDDPDLANTVAMSDLKVQQLQYQQVFQKHAVGGRNTLAATGSPILEEQDHVYYKTTPSHEKIELDHGIDSPMDDDYDEKKRQNTDDSGSSKFELIT
ncbi:hypothetical protein BDB00DRAFT_801223 [Zychaea mexicana]|uniref:uncharacterized protein n=1 Tax=Zychaea mexicana TaxID=64656 RepID=UPI0022FDD77E|nr:uncharacterized protein BDB00DRAFT_801223 [Zychaea mexicana]KAI9498120.1 hypothetical protein BDB00DRAFT_801223 [Zychaea mexicana]